MQSKIIVRFVKWDGPETEPYCNFFGEVVEIINKTQWKVQFYDHFDWNGEPQICDVKYLEII